MDGMVRELYLNNATEEEWKQNEDIFRQKKKKINVWERDFKKKKTYT